MADEYLILVVDDDENNLELLSRFVALSGHIVKTANCGSTAISCVADEKPDLVLLDWMMPDLSGIDVLRSIREDYNENDLPIIMCTALTEAEYVSAALEEGANDFLTKPVNPDVLIARISSQLSRKTAMQTMTAVNRELEETVADRTRKLLEISSTEVEFSQFNARELSTIAAIIRDVADGNVTALLQKRSAANRLWDAMSDNQRNKRDFPRVS